MQITRRNFIGTAATAASVAALSGCVCPFCGKGKKVGKIALQLYSIRTYIKNVGLEKALEDVAKLGYTGVEFAGYWNFNGKQLKKMLDDNGLVGCGTHIGRDALEDKNLKATCEFNLEFGNSTIICPGGGNFPPGKKWGDASGNNDDWWKFLTEFYAKQAEKAEKMGCKIGLHNHMWEFQTKLTSGQLFWDYFFSNTPDSVLMEQDVGWTTCAGFDPCEQYKKYPHRSRTLHAKENGMGKDVKKFDAILGQPGQPGAVPVDWDKLFVATDADGVEWYVVECERHEDDLSAVKPSIEFLKSKGRG